jgi:hypothetical protein
MQINLTETEKAYLAGVLEHATFSILEYKTCQGKISFLPCIASSRMPMDTHNWIISKISTGRTKTNKHSIAWRITGESALLLNKLCFDYFVSKHNHALILREFDRYRTNRYRYTKANSPLSDKDIEICRLLRQSLQRINTQSDLYIKRANRAALMREKIYKPKDQIDPTMHNNIFDFFDGTFAEDDAKQAKSIFDYFFDN